MAYSLIDSVSARSSDTNGFTTGAIDTTGANLIVVAVTSFVSGPTVTVSDSKSNSYTPLTEYAGAGGLEIRLFYHLTPSVGGSHTFTCVGNASYPVLCAAAFSNSSASAFEEENGATGESINTIQPGNVTPDDDNGLVISACGTAVASDAVADSSFIEAEIQQYNIGVSMGCTLAYKIQTAAGAENPNWTWGGASASSVAAAIAVFNLAGGAVYIRRPVIGGGMF
jgi:hypothetical protein